MKRKDDAYAAAVAAGPKKGTDAPDQPEALRPRSSRQRDLRGG